MKYKIKFTTLRNWICVITPDRLQIGCFKGTWKEWEENTIKSVLDDKNSRYPSGIEAIYKAIIGDLLAIKSSVEKAIISVKI